MTRKLSQSVLDLVVEVLVELGTLHEAVSKTSLLMRQQFLLIQTDNARSMALFHGFGSHLMVELILKLTSKHCKVEASALVC